MFSAESSSTSDQQQPATPRDASGPRSLAALPDGNIAVGFRSGRVTVYTPAGRRLWSVDLASRGGGRGAAVAMVAAGGAFCERRAEKQKQKQKKPLDLLSGDEGEEEEDDDDDQEEEAAATTTMPLLPRGQEKGRLWVGTADGSLSVLSAADGARPARYSSKSWAHAA